MSTLFQVLSKTKCVNTPYLYPYWWKTLSMSYVCIYFYLFSCIYFASLYDILDFRKKTHWQPFYFVIDKDVINDLQWLVIWDVISKYINLKKWLKRVAYHIKNEYCLSNNLLLNMEINERRAFHIFLHFYNLLQQWQILTIMDYLILMIWRQLLQAHQ